MPKTSVGVGAQSSVRALVTKILKPHDSRGRQPPSVVAEQGNRGFSVGTGDVPGSGISEEVGVAHLEPVARGADSTKRATP